MKCGNDHSSSSLPGFALTLVPFFTAASGDPRDRAQSGKAPGLGKKNHRDAIHMSEKWARL